MTEDRTPSGRASPGLPLTASSKADEGDLANSALGPRSTWPAALKVASATVAKALTPLALFWAEDLIFLPNARFAALLDERASAAAGRSAREVFSGVWSEFGLAVEATLATGSPRELCNLKVSLHRDGLPEDAWFSFTFNPVFDEEGVVAGVLGLAVETTREVAQARRDAFRLQLETEVRALSEPAAMAQGVIDAFGVLLGLSHAVFAEAAGDDMTVRPKVRFPAAGEPGPETVDLHRLGARAEALLRAGETFVSADLTAERDATPQDLGFVSCLCVPVVREGAFRGAFLVGRPEVRRWSAADINLAEEVTGLVWEVLARVQVQTAMVVSEARWRTLFERLQEALAVGEVTRDDKGRICRFSLVDTNTAWDALFGGSAAAAIGDLDHGAAATWARAAAEVVDSGSTATFTCQIGPQGRWFEGRAFGVEPERFAVLLLDVTARRDAEAALRESEDHYRHTVELDPQATWTAGADGRLERVNPRWIEWTGGGADKDARFDSLHPLDKLRTTEAWRHSVETGEPYDIEHRVRMRDGGYRWMHTRAVPRRDTGGRITRWYGATEDIHERWTAQQQLRELNDTLERQVAERTAALASSQAQLRTIFETSYQYQGLLDLDGRLLDANATALKDVSATLQQVKGTLVWDTPWFANTPSLRPLIRKAVAEAAAGRSTRQEVTLDLPNGERVFDVSIRPVRDATGRVVAVVPEAVETTERRRAEQALRQSQKMEAVGQLTGGIAHDFNNMLAVVIGSLDLLGRRIGVADARAQRYVAAATDGARRAALLTQRLLAFSRQQPLNPQAVDATRLISDLSDLLRGSVGSQVQVVLDFAPATWPVRVDANQLENVLLNLAVNARDAMPEGGRLTIATANSWLAEEPVAEAGGGDHGEYVRISVQDTGVGMSPDVIARAFDPFFTTKEVGKGTGLGLSQVYGFVTQSGGQVKIRSEPGKGASIDLYLPRHLGAVEAAVPPATGPGRSRGRETVLVVEDEAAVRQVSVEAVRELGYLPLEAADATEALEILKTRPDVALLFTDVVLPEVNGRLLAEQARRLRPGLKVLFTTGYARSGGEAGEMDGPVLSKPFTLDDLAGQLRRTLDEPTS